MFTDGNQLASGVGVVVVIIVIILIIWLVHETAERNNRLECEGIEPCEVSWSLNGLGSQGHGSCFSNEVIFWSVIALIIVLILGGAAALATNKNYAMRGSNSASARASAGLSNMSGMGRSAARSSVL